MASRKDTMNENVITYVIGGAATLGVGVGFATDNLLPGVLIGTGLGMLVAAVIASRNK